ncbi:MAG: 1-deoxy-D-xylulose-5-phosphate synthase [Termitinemataceae bacterium]|nr:MAG: 1-deoxy-D-xylulose-5-phosphate synthase [Termitinemataceae bacterium]
MENSGGDSEQDYSKPIIQQIHEPGDLKKLKLNELYDLAAQIRSLILRTVGKNGGHLSSNLGVVELSIALHRVFDSPKDKIIWDVGHQCYTHKILTGRIDAFDNLRRFGGISGFPRRKESPHDAFDVGHASTSVSAALGFLVKEHLFQGAQLSPECTPHRCVAVIGDGALTGGLSYEALSHAGQLGLPLIVILNDNRMSISKNVGALSRYLSRISLKNYYQTFRHSFDALVQKVPIIGKALFKAIVRLKRAVKAVFYHDNFFVNLGFEYAGPVDGHDIAQLEKVLNDLSNIKGPVVVHVITQKGRGYKPAENDPSTFHAVAPFDIECGIQNTDTRLTWTKVFGEALVQNARTNNKIAAVTAAMERGTGLSQFKAEFPSHFFDVGIAEEHAVTFCGALAAAGLKPVVSIYSTFIQRSLDQIIHDTALQNVGVVFAIDRAGFVSNDGETHQGLFDIGIFRTVPDATILCPASAAELKAMLQFALSQKRLCAIRYPKDIVPQENDAFLLPLEIGRGVFLAPISTSINDAQICLAFTGSLYQQAADAANLLTQQGCNVSLYNLRFLKPIDEDYLCGILNTYKTVVLIEEGSSCGGFSEYICALAGQRNCTAKIICINAQCKFYTQGSRAELLKLNGMDAEGIAQKVMHDSITQDSIGASHRVQ